MKRCFIKTPGTALILTFFFIVLLTMEVALIALIAQRSLGEEGIMLADNIQARQGLSVAMSQAERKLYSYIRQNGEGNVTVDFAYGGSAAITDQAVTGTDPENPGAGETVDTGVDINAWVSDRRGYWYKITAQATIDQVELTSHKWVRVNPCSTGTGSGTLTTIMSGPEEPGEDYATYVAPSGRVWFGDTGSTSDFYTWHEGTGLSLIIGNRRDLGAWGAGDVATQNENGSYRILFAEYHCSGGANVYTWHEGTGLSTLVTNVCAAGNDVDYHSATGDFLFNDRTHLYRYSSANGLSILASSLENCGGDCNRVLEADPAGQYIYLFDDEYASDGKVYRYSNSSGDLTTLLSGYNRPGKGGSFKISQSGRVFWGGADTDVVADVYTYHPSTGLSVIATGLEGPGFQNSMAMDYEGDRVYFGEAKDQEFYTWHLSTGLSTIVSLSSNPGYWSVEFDKSVGKVMFSTGGTTPQRLFVYKPGEGLTTIDSGGGSAGRDPANYDQGVFFTGADYTRAFRVYDDNTGNLTTIVDQHEINWGARASIEADPNTGRVFFADTNSANPNYLWTWHADTGLSTIMSYGGSTLHDMRYSAEERTLYFSTEGVSPATIWAYGVPYNECEARGY